jgi:hypothetical protein
MTLTRSHADIVQGKLGDSGVELEQQGQRLTNATSSTEDGHLGQLPGKDVGVSIVTSGTMHSREPQQMAYLTGRRREGATLEHGGHPGGGKHLDYLVSG